MPRMGFTRKKMTEHTPKATLASDVDWSKIAPPMVHVDHTSDEATSPPRLTVVVEASSAVSSEEPVEASGALEVPEPTGDAAMVHVDHGAESASPESRDVLVALPLSQIVPNPRQPRSYFDEEDLADLSASIAETGVLQPVVVRAAGPNKWELIMGERRLRASRLAGLEVISAIVREVPDDQLLKEAIIENIQRAALNPIEEALALQALLDDWGVSQEEVGKAIGKSRISVSHSISLLRLPDDVQRRVASGVLSKGHAKALMGVDDPATVRMLADRVVAETMSVRGLEEAVLMLDLAEQKTPRRGRSTRRRVTYPEVAEAFEAKLDTRVKIEGSTKRGRIVVEFGGPEDLKRICQVLEIPTVL